MDNQIFSRLLQHNNWANQQIIRACTGLSAGQLDAEPGSATMGSIRDTLTHMVRSQHGYLSLLTLPAKERTRINPQMDELAEAANASGAALLELVKGEQSSLPDARLETTDGYFVESWVVLVQVINHATEHREQIKSMLSALGITPPDIDGWDYGEAVGALVPVKDESQP
jgi:uncharacterized damage-inducible protein DinB